VSSFEKSRDHHADAHAGRAFETTAHIDYEFGSSTELGGPFLGYNAVDSQGFYMHVPAHILQQAMDIFLRAAYPAGLPAAVSERLDRIRALPAGDVPAEFFERDVPGAAGSLALRLGQPVYPFMKLVLDPVPGNAASCLGQDFLLRVDAHDQHLHAPSNSPDAAWLATVRQSNKELGERIEAAWTAAGLPTFKEYLRIQLEARKRSCAQER
jgi:hypothetical protein